MRAANHSVGTVIVNYRRYDLVERCIGSLLASSRVPDPIVVVDNASRPTLLGDVEQRFPSIRAIANADNRGYAAACNQGWRSMSTDFVLFVNPDVTVEADCLGRCLEAAGNDDSIAVVTCRLVRPDGRLDHACHRGIPTPSAALAYALRLHRVWPRSRRLGRYTMSWLDPSTDHDVEACSGAFMLVRRDALEVVGGWDERFWFYAEDIDLCLRIGRLGKRTRYVADARATHLKGASSGLRTPTRELDDEARAHKRRVQRAIVDSHSLFFREHFQRTTPGLVSAAILGMFALQRVRLRLATRLDARRSG